MIESCLFHFSKLVAAEIKLLSSSACFHLSIVIKQKFRPKNALFLLKNPENRYALGQSPQTPISLQQLGASPSFAPSDKFGFQTFHQKALGALDIIISN